MLSPASTVQAFSPTLSPSAGWRVSYGSPGNSVVPHLTKPNTMPGRSGADNGPGAALFLTLERGDDLQAFRRLAETH